MLLLENWGNDNASNSFDLLLPVEVMGKGVSQKLPSEALDSLCTYVNSVCDVLSIDFRTFCLQIHFFQITFHPKTVFLFHVSK